MAKDGKLKRPKKLTNAQITESLFNIGDALNYQMQVFKAFQNYMSDYVEWKGDSKKFGAYIKDKFEKLEKEHKEKENGKNKKPIKADSKGKARAVKASKKK